MSRSVRTKSGLATVGIAAAFVIGAFGSVAQSRDWDCSDFNTHKQAQKFFKHHHPKQDPYRLDADNDGIACEDLP
jgi:hypothetical protein